MNHIINMGQRRWSVMTTNLISIKGTSEGIILTLNDEAAFKDIFEELKTFLAKNHLNMKSDNVLITVKLGYRYLKEKQEQELRKLLEEEYKLNIETLKSELALKNKILADFTKTQIKTYSRVVRSGQTITAKGSVLLIGDVNPGGKIEATGNIFILGKLLGTAHAGMNGYTDAIISASYMKPTQLRIAEYISRSPDYESEGVYLDYASVQGEESKIVLNKIRAYPRLEKELNAFERSLLDE